MTITRRQLLLSSAAAAATATLALPSQGRAKPLSSTESDEQERTDVIRSILYWRYGLWLYTTNIYECARSHNYVSYANDLRQFTYIMEWQEDTTPTDVPAVVSKSFRLPKNAAHKWSYVTDLMVGRPHELREGEALSFSYVNTLLYPYTEAGKPNSIGIKVPCAIPTCNNMVGVDLDPIKGGSSLYAIEHKGPILAPSWSKNVTCRQDVFGSGSSCSRLNNDSLRRLTDEDSIVCTVDYRSPKQDLIVFYDEEARRYGYINRPSERTLRSKLSAKRAITWAPLSEISAVGGSTRTVAGGELFGER